MNAIMLSLCRPTRSRRDHIHGSLRQEIAQLWSCTPAWVAWVQGRLGAVAGASADARVVPADMLLLAGTCIVEEAVLTGESTPQWKTPVGAPSDNGSEAAAGEGSDAVAESAGVDPCARLNIKRDKALVLFGGTKILQHTPDKTARLRTPDGGCLAVVLRTGFETAQGAGWHQLSLGFAGSTIRVWLCCRR